MFCQGHFKLDRGCSGEVRAIAEELIRTWSRPSQVGILLQMESPVANSNLPEAYSPHFNGIFTVF